MHGPPSTTATSYRRAAAWCGVAYLLLLLVVALGWLQPLDLWLTRTARFELPCWTLTLSATAAVVLAGEVSLLYTGLLALYCGWWGRPLLGGWLLGVLLILVGVEFLCKLAFPHPAPAVLAGDLSRPACQQLAYPLTRVVVANTLPSGYAIRTAYLGLVLAALLGARWPRRARAGYGLLLVVGLLLGATRVVVGSHWASDVLAGLLLGGGGACVVLAQAEGFRWLRRGGG